MSKKYDEIMEHIEVTSDMKARVLCNVRINNFQENKYTNRQISHIKRYFYLAACLAIIIASFIAVPNLLNMQTQPPIQVIPNIQNFETVEQLASAAGFQIDDLSNLPFLPEKITYTLYDEETAEIEYSSKNYVVTYRKSKGEYDNSGDFNTYDNEKTIKISDTEISLKGEQNGCRLAIWHINNFSYSISLIEGNSVSEEIMVTMIGSLG